MASAAKTSYITPEEYLALERKAQFKSEYHHGQIYAMAGTTRMHNLITGNLFNQLKNQLRGRPCEVYVLDIRVRASETGSYMYPDLVAVCGVAQFVTEELDTLSNPQLVVEILSPSSEAYDRGAKFTEYRRSASLRDYVLISQDKVLVEKFSRRGDEWVLAESNRLDDLLRLEPVGSEVALRDIYEGVTF